MTAPVRDAGYLALVGHLGANLAGNPQAVHDAKHPAILDLATSVVIR